MIFEQQTFENSEIVLDGNEYKACDFQNCILFYEGGSLPKFAQCNVTGCTFTLKDAADRTLSFMKWMHSIYPDGPKIIDGLFDEVRGLR